MKVLLVNGGPRQAAAPPAHSPRSPSSSMPKASIPRCSSWAVKPFATALAVANAASSIAAAADDDVVNRLIAAAEQADGFVFGSPVYYAHPSGRILSALDRTFYAGSKAFAHKPGAAVAVARRGGTSTTFDVLNKVLHHQPDARGSLHVLEQRLWCHAGRGRPGRRGPGHHAKHR